ncbi:uncharacterized protein LOC143875953 [Tasmannia lanceolata]|uniref:uncharacterized protein LOC143875953 n=1 Tax=Tasmannia lanceolata TaxID=3420 RepID=UPI00406403C2
MKIVNSWNIRGLCTSNKTKEITELIRKTRAPICCIIETKAKIHKLNDYASQVCEGWKVHGNYLAVIKGRIWILWNPNLVDINILEESSQYVHSEVRIIQTNQYFNLTAVYAHNYYISRRALWSNLESLEPGISLPWLLVGDFNVVRYASERLGNTNHHLNEMEEFNECLTNCSLTDLRSDSQTWTWHNRSSANRKVAKLDRSLVNELCLHQFPRAFTEFLPPGISDHCPLSISIHPQENLGPKPFRFMNMWIEDRSLFPIVERAWNFNFKGNPMYQLCRKLKEVKAHLKAWNKDIFGRVDITTPLIRNKLSETQTLLQSDPLNLDLISLEDKLRSDLIIASSLEESLFKQKSRVQWLQLGDSNSKFFHSSMKSRHHQNSILAINGPNNSQTSNPKEIADIFLNHFIRVLNNGKSQNLPPPNPIRRLTADQASSLSKEVTKEEIREVVFSS